MWRWRYVVLVIVVIIISVISFGRVRAATSAAVTVTATGYVVPSVNAFTATYVSDYQVDLDWQVVHWVEYTMIRAAIGRYPESRTDGYEVYYGTGTSASDTGCSLDETATEYCYAAWAYDSDDNLWSPIQARTSIIGEGVTLLANALSNVGFTWVALVAIVLISALGFWKPIAPIFQILAGMSFMLGLQWYDVNGTELGMGISLGLICYSLVCLGLTYKVIFYTGRQENE